MVFRLCLILVFCVATVVHAHVQSVTGFIDGIVRDQSGAVLPGVTLAIVHSATGLHRTLVTDDSGRFRAPLLPAGRYELTATLAGFSTLTHTVAVTVGEGAALRLELKVAGVAETVDVPGATSSIDRNRPGVSATVDEAAVRHLPVNGRNFIDFVLLTPGVTRDARAGDLSFAGQRGTLNSLIVDGADNNNTFAGQTLGRTGSGRAPYQFSQDAVQEFQVNSNAFSAEHGRAGGAVINVVTKSGTNAFNGSVFEHYRDQALNAINPINALNQRPKSPYHYHQFGGVLGGPLRRNRDFFFFNYDGQRNSQTNLVFLNLPTTTPADAATTAGLERLRPLAFSWSQRLDQDVFLMKTDHLVTPGQRLSIRYNHQNFTGEGYESSGSQIAHEHSGASLVKTRALSTIWTGVFRRAFNELRVQAVRDHEPGEANSDDPEAVVQQDGANVLIIGRNNFSPRATTIDRIQVADTLTWIRGAHNLKAGVDFQFDRVHNVFPGFFSGSYMFRSLASFARGIPDGPNEFYQQSFAGPGTTGAETHPDLEEYSIFAQDDWRPRPDVTVALGMRYDVMKLAAPPVRNPDPQLAAAGIGASHFPIDANNLGPRLGFAWSPHDRPYILRGGWGLFYGRTPAIMATAAGSNNGINIVSLTFSGQAVPTYPARFTEIPASGVGTRPHLVYVDADFENPRLMHGNIGFQWELARDLSLSATYLHVSGVDLPRSIDRNLGPQGVRTVTIAGTGRAFSQPFFGANRPFTNFQRVVAFESSAESRYNGLTLELNRRMAGDVFFRVAYTLGKVEDTAPDATAVLVGNVQDDAKFASNPVDFEADRAPGNNDQRHRLVASGVYGTNRLASRLSGVRRALAGGWWFSGILSVQSGQRYSARVSGDLNGDGNARNDLAPGTRRNAFRLPSTMTFDPRVARDLAVAGRVRAQLIVEAFNLFNRDNINAVIPIAYALSGTTLTQSETFKRPVGNAGERIVQLGARLSF